MNKTRLALFAAGLVILPTTSMANDFSTATRVKYVMQCVEATGMNLYEGVNKCSCVVDEIAKVMTQRQFEDADTSYQLRNLPADRGGMFRDDDESNNDIKLLKTTTASAYQSCRIRLKKK
jgi:hypothetical protein